MTVEGMYIKLGNQDKRPKEIWKQGTDIKPTETEHGVGRQNTQRPMLDVGVFYVQHTAHRDTTKLHAKRWNDNEACIKVTVNELGLSMHTWIT